MARRILRYLRPYRGRLAAAGVCLLAQAAAGLAPAFIVKAFVDHLQGRSGSFDRLWGLVAAAAGLALLGGLVGVLRTWLVLVVSTGVVARLRQEIAEKLLWQSVGYYTGSRGGELTSRLLNDVAAVERTVGEGALALARDAVTGVLCVVAMFLLEWHLALLSLTVVPLVVLALRSAGRPIYRYRREVQERLAALTVHVQESLSLSGIMLVKSFGREPAERERIQALTDAVRRSQVAAGMSARWFGLALGALQLVGPVVLLLAGGWLVLNGDATLGTVVAFVTLLAVRFGASVMGVGTGAVAVIGALPSWERIFDLLDSSVDIRERPGAIALAPARGAVRLESVTFSYPRQTRPALENVSLEIAPGQLVALVGPSGAGKSTLSSLVPRFYDPQAGVVRIDGHDVRDLTLPSLGAAVGLVLQETYLFHGSLGDNLRYARPEATTDDLVAACRDAYLQEVLDGLPDGLDTVVGERGHRLSGGEKQRVAIARVILKDPPILILDEATSHLDSVSEHLVQEALARLFRGRTSLVIAHRLSTVLAADMIVVLDRGRIVERGTHAQLVDAGGLYGSLYAMQFRSDVARGDQAQPADNPRAATDARRLMVALRFLRAAREDPRLQDRLGRLDPAEGLQPVVDIAAARGVHLPRRGPTGGPRARLGFAPGPLRARGPGGHRRERDQHLWRW